MKVKVLIRPKKGILDPQGEAITGALESLGFSGISNVRQGKLVELDLENAKSADEAKKIAREMCEKLLANTIMEEFEVEIAA